jgi:type IV secretory pathway VirJ component
MKIKKPVLVCLLLSITLLGSCLIWFKSLPIISDTLSTEHFGNIAIAQPMFRSRGLVLAFVDTKKFPSDDLAKKLASVGLVAAIVDSTAFVNAAIAATEQCVSVQHISESISTLLKVLPTSSVNRLIISGIAEGALIPFINAHSESGLPTTNLSVGFTVSLPAGLVLCPPLMNDPKNLVTSPALKGSWRSAWVDKPDKETELFIKEKIEGADTYIAPYDTPLDLLLVNELKSSIGENGKALPPMPIIEIPAVKPSDTVTLFYSGDGGWRDLDRSVAEEMAALNYPVLGVDVLRYFWERRTPEQAASDLVATMTYYRKNWGVKSFVLAGFSFGADILPVIYNHLTAQDKDSVRLIVLLALGNYADFEIHVAGWLGKSTREMPLAAELAKMPTDKILCIYGKEEKAATGTACASLHNTDAKIMELPGGHHFDKDYPKLARLILDVYKQHAIN